jgi:8-oxo-dGTP diphosphatase
MTRTPVLAAGGIVLRQARPPLIAVVRLRKGNEWVLPKGKLDDGETPRDAAEREVLEETGHDVSVHEFLGTLAYDAGGRSKIVHYWRMETNGGQSRDLMGDVRAVDWLPLEAALERLSRDHERAFLANVGPLALEAAKRSAERKAPAPVKRRRRAIPPKPSLDISTPAEGAALAAEQSQPPLGERDRIETNGIETNGIETGAIETGLSASSIMPAMNGSSVEAFPAACLPLSQHQATGPAKQRLRVDLMRKVRAWLQRVA